MVSIGLQMNKKRDKEFPARRSKYRPTQAQ
jgi:hypothetical protein